MRSIVIFAQTKVAAGVIRCLLPRRHMEKVAVQITDSAALRSPELMEEYREGCRLLQQVIREQEGGSDHVTAAVDWVDLYQLSPLGSDPWSSLISMLILTFPDVRWVFCVSSSVHVPGGSEDLIRVRKMHDLATLEVGKTEPLCDPTGLRAWIAERTNKLGKNEGIHLPVRRSVAVALDDESHYAYFFGYTAYRFGYRAWIVDSAEMLARFGVNSRDRPDSLVWLLPPDLVLEDLFLSFPDSRGIHGRDKGLSDLRIREEAYPGLATPRERRVLITVGHGRAFGWEVGRRHRAYLKARNIRTVFKPIAGIFAAFSAFGVTVDKDFRVRKRGLKGRGSRHSAPGRILAIASSLIRRAQSSLGDVRSVEDAVYGAVLAGQAAELLGGQTPTSSFEALGLKHQFEVLAESQAYGIEYSLNLDGRFAEIKDDVGEISGQHAKRHRRRVELNARLRILEDLARRFRDRNQFDEEQRCLREARRLYFALWTRRKRWRLLLAPFLAYINLALRSLTSFVLLVLAWLGMFGLAYYILQSVLIDPLMQRTWPEAFSAAAVFFFSLQSAGDYWMAGAHIAHPAAWNTLLAFQGAIATLHIGLLVAHLYIILSRR